MPSYRIDQAPTSRAGCKNKECKDEGIKILKGELRFGTWVDTENFQSFFWRHWGCVTPKIISNVIDLVGKGDDRDLDMLDGFEGLPSELQEKIKKSLDQGHVDDEDWKGDPELNRPGQHGFRLRTPKKKAAKADKEGSDEANEEESPAKSSKGKAGKKDKAEAAENETPAKTSKAKKRGRVQVDEDDDAKDADAAKPKRAKRKATPKKAPPVSDVSDGDENDEDDFEVAEPKPKASKKGHQAGKGAAVAKSSTTRPKRGKKVKEDTEENGEAEPAAKKPKRGRKKST
ncbi:hypothetical protein BDV12DRAFT_164939 [Aspergillus spectabilis]